MSRQRSLRQRRVWIQLHRLARLSTCRLAHARLHQHPRHLQVMHRFVGMQRNQTAITRQRLLHFAFAQKRFALRLKIHEDRGPAINSATLLRNSVASATV